MLNIDIIISILHKNSEEFTKVTEQTELCLRKVAEGYNSLVLDVQGLIACDNVSKDVKQALTKYIDDSEKVMANVK